MSVATIACGGTDGPRPFVAASGPRVLTLSIEHQSHMGNGFAVVGLAVTVDGREVYTTGAEEVDAASIPSPLCVAREIVAAGEHEVAVETRMRGVGYGIFSYINNYRFRANGTSRVEVPSGSLGVHVVVVSGEQGGPETPLEERPAITITSAPLADLSGGCQPARR